MRTTWKMPSELVELRDGRTRVPRRFAIEGPPPTLPDGFEIKMEVEVDPATGRPNCRALSLRAINGDPVSATVLRQVPIQRLMRAALTDAAVEVERTGPSQFVITPLAPDGRARLYRRLTREPRRGAPLTDVELQQVAQTYRAAVDRGHPPTKMLADRMGVSRATASRWVRAARDRGYLGEKRVGLAGEQEAVAGSMD